MNAFEQLKKRAFLFHERTGCDIGISSEYITIDDDVSINNQANWALDNELVTESEATKALEEWTGQKFPTVEEIMPTVTVPPIQWEEIGSGFGGGFAGGVYDILLSFNNGYNCFYNGNELDGGLSYATAAEAKTVCYNYKYESVVVALEGSGVIVKPCVGCLDLGEGD